MARKLELAADVVRALQQLAAWLLPHHNRLIAPAHRERRVALAVAELSYFNLGDVARRADGLVQILDELRRIERVALPRLRLGGSLAGLV
jgi:hypothetical protein